MKILQEFPNVFQPLDECFVGYDSACILKAYCDYNAARYPNLPIAKLIADIKKVHDRLYIQNHHPLCKMGQLDPDKYDALDVVNTQVAEQFLLHLLIFIYTFRNTSALRAQLWLYLILHNWNIIKKECRLSYSVPSSDQKKKLPYL